MALQRSTPRTSRRYRRCNGCKGPIDCGDRYIEHVAAPDPFGEVGNRSWWRLAECAWCAERYGRPLTPRED